MPNLGTPEIIIIALVVVLLFGGKKLPDAARGLGRSLRIFKAETKGLRDDDADDLPRQSLPPVQRSTPHPAPPAQPQNSQPVEHDARRDTT